MNLLLAAADDAPKNMNGGWGLLVFVLLAIVVFFLFRSMNKHLRKAQRMNEDEKAPGDVRPRDSVPPQQPKS